MKPSFSEKIIAWGRLHGRKQLPWQQKITPYRIWVSEIMLQQTQVDTVIPYYERFMLRFPDVQTLAAAETDEVLHLWSGLGYYARARNLHKTARVIVKDHQGEFPAVTGRLEQLPGIGRSTAGAIVSLSQNRFGVILDGNVKRVLARFYAVEGWPGHLQVQKKLWQLAENVTSSQQTALYNQTMMDLGSKVCTRTKPDCMACPLQTECLASQHQAQSLYPGKKPKKALPVRTTRMLMVVNAKGRLLLEQRPLTGIWGGLWGLPERPVIPEPAAEGRGVDEKMLEKLHDLPVRRHTFSHFHLDIYPEIYLAISHGPDQVNERQTKWYDLYKPAELGLAAPVAVMVEELKAYLQENKSVKNR